MTVKEFYDKEFSDIPNAINGSFQLDDASTITIYWNPDKPPEYKDKGVYLGICKSRYGEEIKRSYFPMNTKLEELDKIFNNKISKAILNEIE